MKAGPALIFLLLAAFAVTGQKYPDRIDGYKVHNKPVEINSNDTKDEKRDFDLRFEDPTFTGASITAIKFELQASVRAERAGTIEKIRFERLTVNGIPVEVNEFTAAFDLVANEMIELPERFSASVSSLRAANAVWLELTDPKKEWRVMGTAFVFGRFKRFGMTFRRAIPVEFDLSVKNPIPEVRAVIFR
ncbi:MAG TPA: hypothetical protein PLR83_04765 [Pyrinomonadaceae bacterium]|nr:hypothetical protein [Pyrinomonadaceae bacterium]